MKRLLSLLLSLRGRPGPAQTVFLVFLLTSQIQSTALEQTEDWNRAPSSPYWQKLQEKLNNEVLDFTKLY